MPHNTEVLDLNYCGLSQCFLRPCMDIWFPPTVQRIVNPSWLYDLSMSVFRIKTFFFSQLHLSLIVERDSCNGGACSKGPWLDMHSGHCDKGLTFVVVKLAGSASLANVGQLLSSHVIICHLFGLCLSYLLQTHSVRFGISSWCTKASLRPIWWSKIMSKAFPVVSLGTGQRLRFKKGTNLVKMKVIGLLLHHLHLHLKPQPF